VEYIDGVSSIEEEEEDDETEDGSNASTITDEKNEKEKDDEEEEEVQIDTYRVIGIRRRQGECLVSFMIFRLLE
jgi:hypothetical protein